MQLTLQGTVVHAHNFSTQEAASRVQGQSGLHSKFKGSSNYIFFLKKTKNK